MRVNNPSCFGLRKELCMRFPVSNIATCLTLVEFGQSVPMGFGNARNSPLARRISHEERTVLSFPPCNRGLERWHQSQKTHDITRATAGGVPMGSLWFQHCRCGAPNNCYTVSGVSSFSVFDAHTGLEIGDDEGKG